MEKISIQNFGPIIQVEIELKDINIFIGKASSGKSTVAKLFCVFKEAAFRLGITYEKFIQLLTDYKIDFDITSATKIRYENSGMLIEVNNSEIHSNIGESKFDKAFNPIYIPAERMFFAAVSDSIFSILRGGIQLPKRLIDFGAKFEQARNSIKRFSIDFLNLEYEYTGHTDYLKFRDGKRIRLSEASSGLQSMVPLILVIEYNTKPNAEIGNFFVIEESEINVHPPTQKDLAEFIIDRMNRSENRMIIITHSPNFLSALERFLKIPNEKLCNYYFDAGNWGAGYQCVLL
jgi:predicted ATP-dependent endonuclease of OLD family